MLFKQQQVDQASILRERIIADSITDSVIAMNYACSAISSYDLASGIDYLIDTAKNKSLPWLSMNLYDARNNTLPFKPYIIREAGDVRIALLGLTNNLNDSHKELLDGYLIKSWEESLPKIVAEIRETADMVILLSNYPYKINEQIAQNHSDIHLIIQSSTDNANIPPRLVSNTLITQSMGKGKYLGIMRINWTPSKKWGRGKASLLSTAQSKLRDVEWQIKTMENMHAATKLSENERYQLLLKNRSQAADEVAQLSNEMKKNDPDEACSFSNTFIKIEDSGQNDPVVDSIVETARSKSLRAPTSQPEPKHGDSKKAQ